MRSRHSTSYHLGMAKESPEGSDRLKIWLVKKGISRVLEIGIENEVRISISQHFQNLQQRVARKLHANDRARHVPDILVAHIFVLRAGSSLQKVLLALERNLQGRHNDSEAD